MAWSLCPDHRWQLECKLVQQRVARLLHFGPFLDCMFLVGKEPYQVVVGAHKLILAMASPVFETFFYGVAARVGPIRILDIEPETFRALLRYIYKDEIRLTSFNEVCELYYAAEQFMLPYLVNECSRFLSTTLSPATACRGYELAVKMTDPTFKERCLQIIRTNTKEVLADSSFKDADLSTVVMVFSMEYLTVDSELDLFEALASYALAQEWRLGADEPSPAPRVPPAPLRGSTPAPCEPPPASRRSRSSSSDKMVIDLDCCPEMESCDKNPESYRPNPEPHRKSPESFRPEFYLPNPEPQRESPNRKSPESYRPEFNLPNPEPHRKSPEPYRPGFYRPNPEPHSKSPESFRSEFNLPNPEPHSKGPESFRPEFNVPNPEPHRKSPEPYRPGFYRPNPETHCKSPEPYRFGFYRPNPEPHREGPEPQRESPKPHRGSHCVSPEPYRVTCELDRASSEPGPSGDNARLHGESREPLTIRSAMKKIRFLTLSAQQFKLGPAQSLLLTEQETFAIYEHILKKHTTVPLPAGFSASREPRKPPSFNAAGPYVTSWFIGVINNQFALRDMFDGVPDEFRCSHCKHPGTIMKRDYALHYICHCPSFSVQRYDYEMVCQVRRSKPFTEEIRKNEDAIEALLLFIVQIDNIVKNYKAEHQNDRD